MLSVCFDHPADWSNHGHRPIWIFLQKLQREHSKSTHIELHSNTTQTAKLYSEVYTQCTNPSWSLSCFFIEWLQLYPTHTVSCVFTDASCQATSWHLLRCSDVNVTASPKTHRAHVLAWRRLSKQDWEVLQCFEGDVLIPFFSDFWYHPFCNRSSLRDNQVVLLLLLDCWFNWGWSWRCFWCRRSLFSICLWLNSSDRTSRKLRVCTSFSQFVHTVQAD